MNYLNYLQQGGEANNIQAQIAQLVLAAMSGDEQANQQIQQIMQAADNGDAKAKLIAVLIQETIAKLQNLPEPTTMKCGGKVRKKIVKASCGKKAEEGMKIPDKRKLSKGGCPCQLKRVGGRLIEVSTCLPINAEGGNIKFLGHGGIYKKVLSDASNQIKLEKPNVPTLRGASFVADSFNSTPRTSNASTLKESTNNTQASSYKGLFNGALKSLAARKQWVKANADYLKAKGWTDAQIAAYQGSAKDNTSLNKLIGGLDAWKQAQIEQLTSNMDLGRMEPNFAVKPKTSDDAAIEVRKEIEANPEYAKILQAKKALELADLKKAEEKHPIVSSYLLAHVYPNYNRLESFLMPLYMPYLKPLLK